MNWNTAPTSHGPLAELSDAKRSPPSRKADSNAFT